MKVIGLAHIWNILAMGFAMEIILIYWQYAYGNLGNLYEASFVNVFPKNENIIAKNVTY